MGLFSSEVNLHVGQFLERAVRTKESKDLRALFVQTAHLKISVAHPGLSFFELALEIATSISDHRVVKTPHLFESLEGDSW